MSEKKKMNESRFKKGQTLSALTLPTVDFVKTMLDDSDNSSKIKNTESSQNDNEVKIKTSKTKEPKVHTIYFDEKSEEKSINYDNYLDGYQSNFFQKFFCCENNNNDCFIF